VQSKKYYHEHKSKIILEITNGKKFSLFLVYLNQRHFKSHIRRYGSHLWQKSNGEILYYIYGKAKK
jgi:hypothetical protein